MFRRFGLLSLLSAALLMLAACQGGDDGPGVASVDGRGGAAGAPTTTPAAADRFKKAVAYSRCIREHGVPDFPDPKQGPDGGPVIQMDLGALGVSPAQLQKAQDACKQLAPPGNQSRNQGQYDTALKFAKCMRENGVPDFPDPKRGSDGGIILGGEGGGVNPNSPAFQQAQQKCQPIMQGLGGGQGGGAQAGGTG